ncbi:hypothetical protein PENFLA_c006G10483 [Penicillium flavigenum]|uniref:Uncharacterized protein n=1 Tax=Penicillium flavigenum TaxID=254877 RepID=A0A1V6TLK4_9EURO|nr:hypothetical protein PENFLA_c006G10483 [Penicillium flavigenum]
MSDYYVRELAQREETLKEKGRALRKMQSTDEDEAERRKLDEERKTLREAYWYQEWKFYNWQSSIPRIVLGEMVAVGVAVDVAKNASLLLEEIRELGTAPLGAGAA